MILLLEICFAFQLFNEFKEFFPDNAVEYFVSYYDYYQPEAYIPSSDTYIGKEAMINEEIDKLRHAATSSLLTRRDVLIVAFFSILLCFLATIYPAHQAMKINIAEELRND